jgi:hypothetical protein
MEHQDEVKLWAEIIHRLASPVNGKTLTRPEVSALVQSLDNLTQHIRSLEMESSIDELVHSSSSRRMTSSIL